MSAGFFDRYSKSPVFVLNPGGAANLVWEQSTYSKAPVAGDHDWKWLIGKRFVSYPSIDYAFTEFPAQLQMKKSRETKTRIDVHSAQPENVLVIPSIDNEDKIAFAESHLRDAPENGTLLKTYLGTAIINGQKDRAMAFLKAGIDRRPVIVEWHRMYQQFNRENDSEALLKQYRDLLQADPTSAGLMYLLGRLERDREVSRELFNRSIKTDPQLFYPWYALAYQMESDADFVGARSALQKALQLDPENVEIQAQLFSVRFANREFSQLEAELRDEMQKNPTSMTHCGRLMRVLAAQERLDDMSRLNELYRRDATPNIPPELQATAFGGLDFLSRYLRKDFDEILAHADQAPPELVTSKYCALLELGRLEEAETAIKSLPDPFAINNAFHELCLSIAWRQRGNATRADFWRSLAGEHLVASDSDGKVIDNLLNHASTLTEVDIQQFTTTTNQKAIILVALAQKFPEQKQQLLALAKKLNFALDFPHHFIERAIEAEHKQN
jgi:tetratricopeptide (TPR) repeat protein